MKPGSFLIPACLLLVTILGCGKTNNSTKPSLKIKTINTEVRAGGSLDVVLQFDDKSEDLSQGTFTAIRKRLNQHGLTSGSASPDTLTGPIPQYPDQPSGEFEFRLDWGSYLHQSDTENDTITFKFAAVDRKGNKSDTITSPKIIVDFH